MGAMHAAPADFALGGKPLAEFFGDVTGLAEGVGDSLRVRFWIRGPFGWRAGRVDAHHTIRADAHLAKCACDAAAFANLREEMLAGPVIAHRGAAARGRPNGRDDR